ncbi:MAG TPA: hypothetical protein VJ183_15730 [Chloroflexia bacterium]|nr:hypothetical protein [Chloroflexia bacterium]
MDGVRRAVGAWLAVGVLALLLAGPVARFVGTSATWLDYPYPRAGSEGLVLYESLLVKHGGDIYAPITPERFISGPYPLIYYWLAALLLPDDMPDFSTPGNVPSIFLPGRIISLVAAILAALLIPVIVLLEGGYTREGLRTSAKWLAAAAGFVGGALLITLPQITVWATRFRGDMLMLALTTAGLACVAWGASEGRKQKAESSRQNAVIFVLRPSSFVLYTGAALFALAFYTKQTALAGPVASALYLLLRDWRSGLKWCAAMAALVLVPFALLDLATGHWFYLKMVDYHSLPLRESTLTRLLQFAFLEDQWPLVVLAVGYVLYRLAQWWRVRRSRSGNDIPNLIPLFVLVSLALLPTGAVVGADHNHLLVPGLAICLGVGALIAECGVRSAEFGGKSSRGDILRWMAAPVTIVLLAVYALFTSAPSSWYDPDLTRPSAEAQEQMRKIIYNASQNPGTLFFSDDPGIVALAGKETPYDDPFTMTALAGQGRWDEGAFREMLRTGKFGLLILSCNVPEAPQACRSDTLSPGVKDAIRDGYDVQYRDVLFTYRPK